MALLKAEARQRFLNHSGHLLARQSPLVAANLYSEGTRLSVENEEAISWSRRVQVCGRCGTSLTPGETSEVGIASGKKKWEAGERKGLKPSSSNEGVTALVPKTLIVKCLVCKSRESHPLQREDKAKVKVRGHLVGKSTPNQVPSSLPASEARATTTSTTRSSNSTPPSIATTTKISSKKRSRAGKQKGLQALLSKNKGLLAKHEQDTTTSTGLDLLDLMRELSS
jgi:RNAse P Rpr2/Rpp21/SNM1 subunit domain